MINAPCTTIKIKINHPTVCATKSNWITLSWCTLSNSTTNFQSALQLERVVLTRQGTLLLTWLDPSGTLAQLRSALKITFPGASSRQPNIIHTSLLRIVAAPCSGGDAQHNKVHRQAAGHQQQQAQKQPLATSEDGAKDGSSGGNGSGVIIHNGSIATAGDTGQLPAAAVRAIGAACKQLSCRLRGLCVPVGVLHWVVEKQFSTVSGHKMTISLQDYR